MLLEQPQAVVRADAAQARSLHGRLHLLDRKIEEAGRLHLLVAQGAELLEGSGVIRGQQGTHGVELQADGEPQRCGAAHTGSEQGGGCGAGTYEAASGHQHRVSP